jgi:hypothetical protein
MQRLGVDIGGVIIDRVNDNTDTSFFGPNYLSTTPVPDVFEELGRIVTAEFGDNTWLISKCGPKVEAKSREWLSHHDFYQRTGIARDHVVFCRDRAGKAPIAADLEITHFIDDRLEVLGYLVDIVPNLYLFNPSQAEVVKHAKLLGRVTVVQTWQEIAASLIT